jgi:hypothetical protein
MNPSRLPSLVVSAAVALSCYSLAKADIVEVQFTGIVSATNTPGITGGESFSGGFTYSTGDTFEGTSSGLNTFDLTSSDDSLFLTIGGSTISIGQPLNGVTALVGLAPLTFDSNPNQDYFSVQSDSTAGTVSTSFDLPGDHFSGLSVQLIGSTNFLTSGALPNSFDTGDVTFGFGSPGLASSMTLNFADSSHDDFFTLGEITEVSAISESAVPEPRGLSLAGLAIMALALVFFRRPAGTSSSKSS